MTKASEQSYSEIEARQLMIVDDEPQLLQSLIALFEKHYMVIFADSGVKALELLQQGFSPQVILSDNRMPDGSGIEFLAESTKYVPDAVRVIMTGYTDIREILSAINQGHVYMYLTKPWQVPDLLQAIRICFQHYQVNTHNKRLLLEMEQKHELMRKLNEQMSNTNRRLEETNLVVYEDLLSATRILASMIGAEQRYYHTNQATDAAHIARQLGEMIGITGNKLNFLVIAALVHDIGKIGLPYRILGNKPENLSGPELALYQTHPVRGAELLRKINRFARVADIVEQHHERINGNGFPRKLSGFQIMRESQIIGLIELYHELVYRVEPSRFFSMKAEEPLVLSLSELDQRQRAASDHLLSVTNQFDPDVMEAFFNLANSGKCPELKL